MRFTSRVPLVAILIAAALAPSSAAQTSTQLRELMQRKQSHASQILDAVVTNDWITLERQSAELLRIAEDPAWAPLTAAPYAEYSSAFLRAAQELLAAAQDRDQTTTPLAYVSLTLSCVQCHHHIGRTPLARRPTPGSAPGL